MYVCEMKLANALQFKVEGTKNTHLFVSTNNSSRCASAKSPEPDGSSKEDSGR